MQNLLTVFGAIVVIIGFGIFRARKKLVRKRYLSNVKLKGKVVIVTGANTGIGKETAKDLVRRGAKVILACRDLSKAEKAAEEIRVKTRNLSDVGTVMVKQLDLSSLTSVRSFAKSVIETEPQLHILINNAGVCLCPYTETADGFELQFGTNHLGHFLLTNLLLDLLKKSAPGRIINVSSYAYKQGTIDFDDLNLKNNYGPFKAYRQSKLANVMFTNELSRILEGTNVTCYSLHPGLVITDIGRHLTPGKRFIAGILGPIVANNSELGAQTTIYCAVEESIANESGYFYSDCERENLKSNAQNEDADKKLWKVSAELVKLNKKQE